MIWTALGCLNQFINSIVWNGNAINWAPVWCDISSKITIGVSFAIPACSLIINRRLYTIASVTSVTTTRKERLRGVFIDIAIGVGIPVYAMIIHYVNQGHRFDIYEDIGCFPHVFNTPVYYATMVSVSYILAVGSAIYCVLSIYTFNKRRVQFQQLLASQSTSVTANRYFRLMGLAGTELIFNLALLIFTTVGNTRLGVAPWISWEDTHFGFSHVGQFPAVMWRASPLAEMSMELSRWTVVVCAVLFFGFFGFAEEARKSYRGAYETVGRKLGLNVTSSKGSKGRATNETGPTFSFHLNTSRLRAPTPIQLTRETACKRDTILSFTNLSISAPGSLLDSDSTHSDTTEPKRISFSTSTVASYRASALTVPVVIYSPSSTEPFVIGRMSPEPAMPPGLGGEKALPSVPTDYEEDVPQSAALTSPSVYSVNTQPVCVPPTRDARDMV